MADQTYEVGSPSGPPLQFFRDYTLIIGYSDSAKKKTGGEGILIKDLHISFTIRKSADHLRRSNNSCEISIYNISEDCLRYIEKDYPLIRLDVGYTGTGLSTLFIGNITDVKVERRGPEKIAHIRADTAYSEVNFKAISGSIAAGRKISDSIEHIRVEMGMAKGVYTGTRINSIVPYGFAYSGSPREVLREICLAYNLEYRIDNNILYVNDVEQVINKNLSTVPLLTRDTGLLTMPQWTVGREGRAKKDARKAEGLRCTALINPSVVPGSAIMVEMSDGTRQLRKVDNVTYHGEFEGTEWNMDMELITFDEDAKRKLWREAHKPKRVNKKSLSPSTPLAP